MEDNRPKRPRIASAGINADGGYDSSYEKVNSELPASADENHTATHTAQAEDASNYRGYNGYQQRGYNGYQQRQGGYNNRRYNGYGQQRQDGYQQRQGGYGQRQGGYNQNRPNGYNQQRPGGYGANRNNGYNQQRQGGYNQNPANGYGQNQGGYNQQRQGGYNPRPQQYNQQRSGGYNPNYNRNDGYGRQGGIQQQGEYYQNRNSGGYRQSNGGGYNRQGAYGQQRQGGYQQGGYNNRNNQNFRNPNHKFQRPRQIDYVLEDIDPNEELRLNKYMANAGLCSRREADEYIEKGLVKVNGETVTELGTKISRSDVVEYNGKVVTPERKCYVLLNKPKSCVTTSDDPNGRLTVLDLVKNACNERIYPVGRLDRNTTGVLLLTNDGDLASKLTHPKYVKKKIYHVWTDKDIAEEDMQRIADGIELEDGEIHADAISYVNDLERNQAGIEIHSGRNRIVRRIFESLGYRVTKLDRVYFAGLTKKNLPRGRWRYLTQEEVNFLRMGSFE